MVSPMTHDVFWGKRVQYLIILGLLSGLMTLGWFGYRWYVDRYEQTAYKDLAESIDSYNKALAGQEANWTDVERAFSIAAERHKSSRLYPYFLAYKADALVYQGKQAEALEAMSILINKLTPTHPLYYLYKVKHALMKLDAVQENVQQEGRQELEKLAKDTKNPVRDMALYHLGLTLWYKGDKEQAQKVWDDIAADSHWRQLSQTKIR